MPDIGIGVWIFLIVFVVACLVITYFVEKWRQGYDDR